MHIVEVPARAYRAIEELIREYLDSGQSLGWFQKQLKLICEQHDLQWFCPADRLKFSRNCRYLARCSSMREHRDRRAFDLRKLPIWIFRACDHPDHRQFNGICLPPSHRFWKNRLPPLAAECDCYLTGASSQRMAARLGGEEGKQLPSGWDATGPDTDLLPGVENGWGTAIGPSLADLLNVIINDLVPEKAATRSD